jgi:hypothetical protein
MQRVTILSIDGAALDHLPGPQATHTNNEEAMNMRNTRLSQWWKIGALVALGLLGTATWASAHGGDLGLIHACVTTSGQLRIVGANESCAGSESPVDWNIQGASGPAGPQGPQGPAGISGRTVVTQESAFNADVVKTVTVTCPQGTVPVGGGAYINSAFEGLALQASFPLTLGWVARARNDGPLQTISWNLRVSAICAQVAP